VAAPLVVAALAASLVAGQATGGQAQGGGAPGAATGSSTSARPSPEAGAPGTPGEAEAGASRTIVPLVELSLRTQILASSYTTPTTGTELAPQFLVEPGLALTLGGGRVTFRASYVPRMLVVFSGPGEGTFVYQSVYLGLDSRLDASWTLMLSLNGTYGSQSYLSPVAPPLGTAPGTPPTPTPFPGTPSLDSWSTFDTVTVTGRLSPLTTLRLVAGVTAQSGIGAESLASMPLQVGSRLEAALDLRLSRPNVLATSAYAQVGRLAREVSTPEGVATVHRISFFTGVLETWRHALGPRTDTSLGLGAAYANSESLTRLSYQRFMPSAEAGIRQGFTLEEGARGVAPEPGRGTTGVVLAAMLAVLPYIDPYTALVYNRGTAALSADWTFGPQWRSSTTFSGALVPYRGRVAERSGTATLTAGYLPLRFVTVEAGAFYQYQSGLPGLVYSFTSWGGSLTLILTERARL